VSGAVGGGCGALKSRIDTSINHVSSALVELRLYAMRTKTLMPVFHERALSLIRNKSGIDCLFPTCNMSVGNG
jgi:hypothetical protein